MTRDDDSRRPVYLVLENPLDPTDRKFTLMAAREAGAAPVEVVGASSLPEDAVAVSFGAKATASSGVAEFWSEAQGEAVPRGGGYVVPTWHPYAVRQHWERWDAVLAAIRLAVRIRDGDRPALGTYHVCRTVDEVRALVERLETAPRFSFDVETEGFDTSGPDEILSVQFCFRPGEAFVVPLRGAYRRHEADAFTPEQEAEIEWRFIKRKTGTVEKVAFVRGTRRLARPAIRANEIVCIAEGHGSRGHRCRGVLTDVWSGGPVLYDGPGRMRGKTIPAEMAAVVELLRRVFLSPAEKIAYHGRFDMHALLDQYGIEVSNYVWDGMILFNLLHEDRPDEGYRLETARRWFTTMPKYDRELKSFVRHSFAEVPNEVLWAYGAADADCEYRVVKRMRAELRKESASLLRLYREVTVPYLRALFRMERNGVYVFRDRLDELVAHYQRRLSELRGQMDAICEDLRVLPVEWSNPNALRTLLFSSLRLPRSQAPVTKKGDQPSVSRDALQALLSHVSRRTTQRSQRVKELLQTMLRYRRVEKVLAFLTGVHHQKGIVTHIGEDGRVHSTYLPMTRTGRLSSSQPNMENIKRSEDDQGGDASNYSVRTLFGAPEGYAFVEVDYASQEVRILAELSREPSLLAAGYVCSCGESFVPTDEDPERPLSMRRHLEATGHQYRDPHRETAALIWKVSPEDVTDQQRTYAKRGTFGVAYGQGPEGFARVFEVSVEEAQSFIESFFKARPAVYRYQRHLRERARAGSFVETPYGRRRRAYTVPAAMLFAANGSRILRRMQRQFVNFPIQSTAADVLAQVAAVLGDPETASSLCPPQAFQWARQRFGFDPATRLFEMGVRMVNLVHDSLQFEVPLSCLREAVLVIRDVAEWLPLRSIGMYLPVEVKVGKFWEDNTLHEYAVR